MLRWMNEQLNEQTKKNILKRRRQKKRIRKEKKITPERKDENDEQTKDITMISYKITYRFGMPY